MTLTVHEIRFEHHREALCAVADWLHLRIAGLAPAASAYRQLLIAPEPGGRLTPRGRSPRDALWSGRYGFTSQCRAAGDDPPIPVLNPRAAPEPLQVDLRDTEGAP